ncbi:MAG: DUF2279 domain-containing protein [Pseudomonadota bacterium]
MQSTGDPVVLGAYAALRAYKKRLLLISAMTLSSPLAQAGDLVERSSIVRIHLANTVLREPSDWRSGRHPDVYPDPDLVRRRNLTIILGNAFAVGLYGRNNWWRDGFTNDFRTVNEGWFGQNTYSGGADKLGHFYMNYAGTRLLSRVFEWVGNSPAHSLELGAWLTLGTYTAVEIVDGFSKKWHFSREDALINVAGVGAALLFEKNPQLDRLLDLRFLYRPSKSDSDRFAPFSDYSAQTYLLVAKASGVPALRNHPWLRYVEVAIGYGVRGYHDDPSRAGERSRYVYAGISLNLSELFGETVFKGSGERGRAQRVTDTALEFVQVPGTAALGRHRLSSD